MGRLSAWLVCFLCWSASFKEEWKESEELRKKTVCAHLSYILNIPAIYFKRACNIVRIVQTEFARSETPFLIMQGSKALAISALSAFFTIEFEAPEHLIFPHRATPITQA
ncbi:MAG: hypothetical protein CSA52_03990 [Gammaproteobacteria bacterium]|nr:MAG: hypothetical protein CSB48_10715 [Pseudomonadota bacterium]PIE38039.1 MAG: hypothetical protein CSA52_03990 [Gammaproteobacteria bacterium]